MKGLRILAAIFLGASALTILTFAQQGPRNDDSRTVARPRRPAGNGTTGAAPAPAEAEAPKIPSRFGRAKEGQPPEDTPTFRTDAITVTVDTAVIDNKGHFIPNIPKNYFRVSEDGVPQKISDISLGEAPMTIALVVEFSNRYQSMYSYTWFQTLQATYGFVQTLRPDDYLAVLAYDLRTEMLSDFTTNRQETAAALQRLRIAAFSESNMFDAIVDTAQRMQEIEGRKAIVLIASGVDTFSRLTFDKTRKALQDAGVPIYAVGLMQSIREILDARGYLGGIDRLEFLQADNQMRTFAKETGGMSFFPRFDAEFPGIFRSIAEVLRSNYVLTYTPSNQARDGKVRRIKVELINPATNEPLRVNDEKGKAVKYQIVAKTGYTAPREVE